MLVREDAISPNQACLRFLALGECGRLADVWGFIGGSVPMWNDTTFYAQHVCLPHKKAVVYDHTELMVRRCLWQQK